MRSEHSGLYDAHLPAPDELVHHAIAGQEDEDAVRHHLAVT